MSRQAISWGEMDGAVPEVDKLIALEYAFLPDDETMTYELAICFTAKELKGWDIDLDVITRLGKEKTVQGYTDSTRKVQEGHTSIQVKDLPFGYHRVSSVEITYTKGALTGVQQLLIIEPTGPGKSWEVASNLPQYGYLPVENKQLLIN